jgi:hypothetical protein
MAHEAEFPEFGPDGATEQTAALKDDFSSCWYVWYSDRWRTSPKPVFNWGYAAETAADLREQLDSVMAAAIPELRARLEAAEVAAERLKERAPDRLRAAAIADATADVFVTLRQAREKK